MSKHASVTVYGKNKMSLEWQTEMLDAEMSRSQWIIPNVNVHCALEVHARLSECHDYRPR